MAIAAVMRLFVEDDLVNGVSAERTMSCDACGAMRPAPGFIRYEQRQLCNPCATAYETRRARGLVRTIGAHLDDIHARRDR
ncbi:MAG: hypothetical protein HYX51_04855 [Chloroflexi bacterium]|nr:hypothetical protein [Chloroflexota bacterium]